MVDESLTGSLVERQVEALRERGSTRFGAYLKMVNPRKLRRFEL
jgi:hypothetical protein